VIYLQELFQRALKQLAAEPSHCFAVGDGPEEERAAAALQLMFRKIQSPEDLVRLPAWMRDAATVVRM
jgi:FMN phosphatase YigB (HAD superfamily)